METFYETLDYCFENVLSDLLGQAVQKTIFDLLAKNGIPRTEISTRFDDTVEAMVKTLGACSRVVVMKTITEMYKQYSQRMEFSYQDSLRDRLAMLKESVVANHLLPRRASSEGDLESSGFFDAHPGTSVSHDPGGPYPLKRGVKAS